MKHGKINLYLGALIITIVGAGATFLIMKAAEVEEFGYTDQSLNQFQDAP